MATEIATSGFPNLKAYYRFGTGDLTTDNSGNSHTLTAISDPAETTGVFGGGVDFDGNDGYSIVDHTNLKPTGNFTVGCWFKTSATGVVQGLFCSYSQNTNVAGFYFRLSASNKLNFGTGKNTGTTVGVDYQAITSTATVTDGAWHLGIATWDGSYFRLYLDGAEAATAVSWANAPVYAATNYPRIACQNNTGTNTYFFTGQMDDAFLLNGTVLSLGQIKNLYSYAPSIFFQMF